MDEDNFESENPYAAPKTQVRKRSRSIGEFVGFGPRLGALLLDVLWVAPIQLGIAYLFAGSEGMFDPDRVQSGAELLATTLLTAGPVIAFWYFKGATPGKLALGMKVVDRKTGERPSFGQSIGRYLGYIPSGVVLFLGYLSVLWDRERRGWHDKMSGTAVVRS